jgi:hypothetical protein
MGMQNTYLQHPRYGFTEQQMVDETLTEVALTGTSVERPSGTRMAVCVGIFTLNAGPGEVQLLVEGSNDGSNWFTLGSTTSEDNFTATSTVVLNAASTGQVDLQRFAHLRARAVVVDGAPDFDLQVILTGIGDDSEKFLFTEQFTRAGLTPVSADGDNNIRPSGTALCNAQITASGVVLDGLASVTVSLEGSPDGGTTWLTLGSVSVSGNGSQLISVNGDTFFSLGSYSLLRFSAVDGGGAPGAATAYTIDCYLSCDSVDWTMTDEGGSSGTGPYDPSNVFIAVEFSSPTVEVANVRTLSLHLHQAGGPQLAAQRRIELILYDTSLAGDMDLASNATFTGVSVGTIIAGTGTNRLLITTNASGEATVEITDASVESVYCTAVNPAGPQTTPQLIVSAPEVELAFA